MSAIEYQSFVHIGPGISDHLDMEKRQFGGAEQRRMVSDQACIAFIKSCLDRLELCWPGYRAVRRLVCKRLSRRMAELGLIDCPAYQAWIATHPEEWTRVEPMFRIPISRFYRDQDVFEALGAKVLPEACTHATRSGRDTVRCWSAGCASGEEPYTIILLWRYRLARDWPRLVLSVIATDADEAAIRRAATACYGSSSVKELPHVWLERGFQQADGLFRLKAELRGHVDLRQEDIRKATPSGRFDIVLCRNLAFTYFDEPLRRRVLADILDRLTPGGFLVIGKREALPSGASGLTQLASGLPIYQAGLSPETRP